MAAGKINIFKVLYKIANLPTYYSEKQLMDYALEQSVKLTSSSVGYFHFFNPDNETLQLMTWSKNVFKDCYIADVNHYPLKKAGIWADCVRKKKPVIHNDYPKTRGRKGYPKGHFPVTRHMSVPIFEGRKVVAVMGVGNKKEAYTNEDAEKMQIFAINAWKLIMQKRSEQINQIFKKGFQGSPNSRVLVQYFKDKVKIIDVNPTFTKYYGYKRNEVISKDPSLLKSGKQSREYYKKMWKDLLNPKIGTWKDEIVNKKKNGELLPVILSINTIFDENKKPAYFIADHVDMSSRVEAEEKLKESEERYKQLFSNSFDMIQSIDMKGNLISVNDSWKKTLGYSEKEIKKMNMKDYIHKDCICHCNELFQQIMKGKGKEFIETCFVSKKGGKIFVEGSAQPVYKSGKIVATWGIFKDVTERKKIQEYEMQIEKEKEMNIIRSEFLMRISHELRTPLVPIIGFSSIMLEKLKGENKDYLERIYSNANKLKSLIDKLITVTKLQNNQKLNLEKKDINEIINQAVNEYESFYSVKINVKKEFNIKSKTLLDVDKLKQAVMNLLDNSVSNSKKNSEIIIKTSEDAKKFIIQIIDKGHGIPKSKLETIKKGIYLAKAEPEKLYTGVGVGLLLVNLVVQAHKGELSIESVEGKGTTIIITLPKN